VGFRHKLGAWMPRSGKAVKFTAGTKVVSRSKKRRYLSSRYFQN